MNEPEGAKRLDQYDPATVKLIRKAVPNIMAYDICSVQPMTAPTGLKFKIMRWYHKLFDKRYWKMGYRLITECHRGKHTMRHSCWTHAEFCELCFADQSEADKKITYRQVFNRIFGGTV